MILQEINIKFNFKITLLSLVECNSQSAIKKYSKVLLRGESMKAFG